MAARGAGTDAGEAWFAGFTLQQSLLLAFLAIALVAAKLVLRIKLGIPGHSYLLVAPVLVLARSLVPRFGAATLTGALGGLGLMALGLGPGGPLSVLQFGLSGLAVDAVALLWPGFGGSWTAAAVAGVCLAVARAPVQLAAPLMAGMPLDAAALLVGGKTLSTAAFSLVGALLAVPVARRVLRAHLASTPAPGGPDPDDPHPDRH